MDAQPLAAFAPGRVNLIGDHTDYAGGLALPVAIQLGTTVTGTRGGAEVRLRSSDAPEPAVVPTDAPLAGDVEGWTRYIAGVVAEMDRPAGFRGAVTSTLPVGSGLSSSASLELAVALALGFEGPPLALARLGQRAEQRVSGVPCGLLDQLASAAGVEGHALRVDFADDSFRPVMIPDDVSIEVVHSGESRALADSAYATRRAEVERAARLIGPLRWATRDDVESIRDPGLRSRARHVVSENERVDAFCDALRGGETAEAGRLMIASHRSLRDDFDVSTPGLDALVDRLTARPGVHGARLTGAGFGGCVVALADPGSMDEGWTVRPSDGARLRS